MVELTLGLALAVSTLFTLALMSLPTRCESHGSRKREAIGGKSQGQTTLTVQVLVLGDIGRSPRMQYHSRSFANHGVDVELIGYTDSDLHPAVLHNPRISIVGLRTPPPSWQTSNKLLFLVLGPAKVMFQLWTLWMALGYRTKPAKWMLVQNPPSIPTLFIARLICFLRRTHLVIDWHNFGYSILGMKLGQSHPLVHVSQWYEKTQCRGAQAHLTVTAAMKRVLKQDLGVDAPIFVLHDRPSSYFRPCDSSARKVFLSNLSQTHHLVGEILLGRIRLLVSSTSWTADENFSILLSALCVYSERAANTNAQLPKILAIITGKGPQKDMYLQEIKQLREGKKLEMVDITTAWLSFEEYASLLASADLGVSLHTSSSGVDLPMKVVDMFGAGLPVLGWSKFEAWPELVTEGVNGLGFGSAEQMAEKLTDLFTPGTDLLEKLKNGAIVEGCRRWDDEWDPVAGRLFKLLPD